MGRHLLLGAWGKTLQKIRGQTGRELPADFEPANEVDSTTGKLQGWVPVGDGPEDRWHREAFSGEPDGTYELLGPKVQGNPDGFERHLLVAHGKEVVDAPRSFDTLKEWLASANMEGVVWHHPDGRMVKIKAKDFGIKRQS